jgi:hypothetical protein
MALELPLILGTEPKLASIVLQGFLQQNILFDAMAGKLNGFGIDFLSELTQICSMIGMLVLFFSPSLWKAKYIVSWVALFLIVTLGGATGFEFGYNLGGATGKGLLNMTLDSRSNKCTFEEVKNNDYYCPRLGAGTAIKEKGLKDSTGVGSDTPASAVADTTSNVNTSVQANPDKTLSNLSVYAFKPQIFVLYLTNKLNFELKGALSNLASQTFAEKSQFLNIVQHSRIQDDQLRHWVNAFETNCSQSLYSLTDNKLDDYTVALSYPAGSSTAKSIENTLKNTPITLDQATKTVIGSNAIQQSNAATIATLIDFGTNEYSKEAIAAIGKNGDQAEKDFLTYYSLQNTPDNPIYAAGASKDQINDRLNAIYDLRDNSDTNNYNQSAANLKNHSHLQKNMPVSLVLAKIGTPKSLRLLKNEDDGVNLSKDPDSEYVTVSNCGDMYKELVEYNEKAAEVNRDDLAKQVAMSNNLCPTLIGPFWEWDNGKCTPSSVKDQFDAEIEANVAFMDMIDSINVNCTSADKTACQEAQNEALRMQNRFAMSKAAAENHKNINDSNTIQAGAREGYTGMVGDFTAGFAEKIMGPLVGLKALGESIRVGAYTAVLPIIKNILIAFILVLTPIFFLLGLLVPSWSIGVIITPIIGLLFLQMTDVTMTIVDSVLKSVETVVTSSVGANATDDNDNYTAFMEVIWAMAYVSSFAITAFLMFAVGDTKKVITSMAGMDKTIQQAGMQIVEAGKDIAFAAAKIGAGVATGGAAGGALGAKAASTVAKTAAIGKIAQEEGLKTAWDSLGSVGGNYAKLQSKHMKSGYETIKSEKTANFELKDTYDPVEGEKVSKVTADMRRERALQEATDSSKIDDKHKNMIFEEDLASAKDTNIIKKDSYKKKTEKRAMKPHRHLEAGATDNTRTQGALEETIDSIVHNTGIDKRKFGDTKTTSKDGTTTETKGLISQLKEDLYKDILSQIAVDSQGNPTLPSDEHRLKAGKIAASMSATILENAKNGKSWRTLGADGEVNASGHSLNVKKQDLINNINKQFTKDKTKLDISNINIEQALGSFIKYNKNDVAITTNKMTSSKGETDPDNFIVKDKPGRS